MGYRDRGFTRARTMGRGKLHRISRGPLKEIAGYNAWEVVKLGQILPIEIDCGQLSGKRAQIKSLDDRKQLLMI
jgi:hypothetical protein